MNEPRMYRKRPVMVQALRFDGERNNQTVADWLTRNQCDFEVLNSWDNMLFVKIHTLEGDMIARPGDWIVRGVKGEFYPVAPDIFGLTYEVVRAPALRRR